MVTNYIRRYVMTSGELKRWITLKTNGDDKYTIKMGVKDANGALITSTTMVNTLIDHKEKKIVMW